jgi:hypothetical protein
MLINSGKLQIVLMKKIIIWENLSMMKQTKKMKADENENVSFYRELQTNKPGRQAIDTDSGDSFILL